MPRNEATFNTLYSVLKNEIRSRGLTYRDVAEALGMTANGIKLRFVHQNLSIKQLIALSELFGLTLSELMQRVERPTVSKLTLKQETGLVQNLHLLLVLTRIMDDWSLHDIISTYNLSKAECIGYLLELDRLDIIDLLPNNVIRKRVGRGAEWLPNGPLRRLLRSRLGDYLDSNFDGAYEASFFARANLTPAAIAAFQTDLRQLKARFEALNEECKLVPATERHRIVLFVAEREWELPDFKTMRRPQSKEQSSAVYEMEQD